VTTPATGSFTCARCRGRFTKGRTDEEAAAESLAIWGQQDDLVEVCEDCWQVIRPDRQTGPTKELP
jgi:hypothetical protein